VQEKRRNVRFQKHYTVVFSLKNMPEKICDTSGIRDVSKGGIKFLSFNKYEIGTVLVFQIRFPFVYPRVTLVEGKVVNIVPAGGIYQTSVQFVNVTPQALIDLEQMEKINQKKF
jgi:hypothetical protein